MVYNGTIESLVDDGRALFFQAAQHTTKANVLIALLVGLASLGIVQVLQLVDRRRHRHGNLTPSPPGHWLWGNLTDLAEHVKKGHHIDTYIQELMPKYGKLFTLFFGPMRFTIVVDPEAAKEVLASKNWPKSPTYKMLHPFIGDRSMLVAPTHIWHKQRQAFNPGFQYTYLKGLVPMFVEKTKILIKKLDPVAASGEVVKLTELTGVLALDIICELVLARDMKLQLGDKRPELFQLFSALLGDTAYLGERPHLFWICNKLPFLRLKANRMQRRLDNLILGIVEQTLKAGPSKAGSKNLLQLALDTARTEGDKLDKRDVLSQVKTFLFAGHDTTATVLAMAVYELSHHPEKEARLVEEIQGVLKGREPDADSLNNMKYLAAVVRETLRLWPPAGTARYAPPGSTLMGYDVGEHILYVPHFPLHRDPDLWGPDAEEFRPERWADDIAVSKMHPYSYMPFSRGPRDCIGQTFALLETKAALCMLYQKFTFSYAHDKPEEQKYRIVSHPKYGVPVNVLLRQPVCALLPSKSIKEAMMTMRSRNNSLNLSGEKEMPQLELTYSV